MIGPFFYASEQTLEGVQSFSPSAAKPGRFVELATRRYRPLPMRKVDPVTVEDLCLVHDPEHVAAVFAGATPNGFGNTDPRVPDACLWTVGSLVTATLYAPDCKLAVCSPTSGFHHAGYAFSDGYCTFNGLMVAAAKFLQQHPGARVGILDCDYHYGNGTDDILKHKPELAAHVVHHTAGQYFCPEGDRLEFFAWLHESIEDLNSKECDVVIYQAGADMHIDDPLGGLLDSEDMAQRDRMVFRNLRGGLVWNLAGGYQSGTAGDVNDDPVLEIHRRTLAEANMSDGIRTQFYEERTRQEKRNFIGERAVLRARANRAGYARQPSVYQRDSG